MMADALNYLGNSEAPFRLFNNGDGSYSLSVATGLAGKGNKTPSAATPGTAAASILAANTSRVSALFYNNGTVTAYLGTAANVTAANGMPLLAGGALWDSVSVDAWFGVTASGTGDIRIIEVA